MDIIIIGAGVIGSAIAYNLAKYQLDILVLEKENDVGDKASCANSGILHSGYDPEPNSLKGKLNIIGNRLFTDIAANLDVQLERIGSLTLATKTEELALLDKLMQKAQANGVPVQLLSKEEVLNIEPFINPNVVGGILAPTAGIINPFELTVAFMECAMDNGVSLKLNEEVTAIKRHEGGFVVSTKEHEYFTKIIINCAGVYSDHIHNMVNPPKFTIIPRKGEYYVIDNLYTPYIKHVIFGLPSPAGKGVLVTPTTHYNYLIGPSSDDISDKDDLGTNADVLAKIKARASELTAYLPFASLIREFAGIRAVSDNDDFIIEEASDNFYDVAGICSPGLSASPAIALMIEEMIQKKHSFKLNENYNPRRRPVIRSRDLSVAKRLALIEDNKQYGQIICRCENISEAEVVDAIQRNCGATTIKGVKKRTRPGAGRCQGGFCEPHIIEILSRELHKPKTEIEYAQAKSYILFPRSDGDKHA